MSGPHDETLASGGVQRTAHDDEAYCPACNQSFPIAHETCPNDGARLIKLKATRDPLIGRVFEQRYEIRTALGEGGMGTVYRGWQLSVDREVAIKVVHPSIASDRTAVKRFLREARLSSRLSQPNIVNVYDFGQTEDGILYLVMELLRGNTLAHELEAARAFPLRRVITIGLQLCDALQAAHSMGIVHRDLKPGNVVLLADPPGRDLIKVLDFGLAKSLISDSMTNVTNTDAIVGTPLYMAPEQIEGKATDQRTDLYALGCMLYQMLSGRPPFLGETANVVLAAHLSDPVPRLAATVPGALVATIGKLLAKRPEERLGSAAHVRTALEQIADSGYGASDLADTTPDVPAERLRQSLGLANTQAVAPAAAAVSTAEPRRARGLPIALALGALAIGGGGLALALRGGSTPATRDAAPIAPDASRAVVPIADDAAQLVDAGAPLDAPVDAAKLAPADARVRTSQVRADARVEVQTVRPDAAVVAPPPPDAAPKGLDFVPIRRDAAP